MRRLGLFHGIEFDQDRALPGALPGTTRAGTRAREDAATGSDDRRTGELGVGSQRFGDY